MEKGEGGGDGRHMGCGVERMKKGVGWEGKGQRVRVKWRSGGGRAERRGEGDKEGGSGVEGMEKGEDRGSGRRKGRTEVVECGGVEWGGGWREGRADGGGWEGGQQRGAMEN